MIFTDGVHLISDISLEELHSYARSVGIKRCWFHSGSNHPHYDLPKSMRDRVPLGAKLVGCKEIVRILKERK